MASVAAAIEQAAVAKADISLWWDSHALLFQALDRSITGVRATSSKLEERSSVEYEPRQEFVGEGVLVEKLRANHQWLLNTLGCFKPPSASSRAALESSRVAVGSHTLEITPELRDLALRVSNLLVLDEIQAYILASRVCEPKPMLSNLTETVLLSASISQGRVHSSRTRNIKRLLQNGASQLLRAEPFYSEAFIFMNYYTERQSLLKSTRLLLTCQIAEENINLRSSQAVLEEVKKLVEDGLENKMLEVLKESLASSQPEHLDRGYADLWAEEASLEQTLLLDIIFLLYYEPLCPCTSGRLKDLMVIFEDLIIWKSKGEILPLTNETENALRHARRQAVLIIIEALDLESLLLMVQSDTPFSKGCYSLSVEDLRQLDGIITGLDLERATECAPILLSWATFLCLVSFLPLLDGQAALADVEHTVYARQAYDAGAYSFLLDMLRDRSFGEFDIQVGGYKSVVKTLIAAFLAAYDSAGQMDIDGHNVVIDILCELYRGQETLCLELWDRDSVIDGPIRNLLFSLRDSFPYQTLSLARLLAAQCEGSWPAECVYDFLHKMVEITCLYQRDELSLTNESGNMVQTRITLQVPDAPGLLIPAGTSGHILMELAGGVCLVRWECKHSGIVVLLLRMLQRAVSSYQIEEVFAIVDLFNRMLTSNKGLTQLLLDLNRTVTTVTAQADGGMESSSRLDVVSMICSVINALVQNTGDNVMVASCLGILSSFGLCCPEQVITELGRSILLQPSGSFLSSSDRLAFSGSQLDELIVKAEQSSGYYPLTIAVLDFSRTMVEKGTMVASNSFTSLLMHILGNLFVNHGNWRYQQWHDRWMITTKIIGIMRSLVTSVIRTREISPLKGIFELLLFDTVVHDVLMNVLSINAQELEELHFNRAIGFKEIEWLQQAIYSVLMLLHDLVLDVIIGVSSQEYGGVTLLEQALYGKATGSLPVVTAIASFLSFSRNPELQFASAKALTSLFLLAQRSRSHPSSIASYISGNEQKIAMRTTIAELLSEEIAFSNYSLFGAVVDLLTAAVRWQPALVEHFLFPVEQSTIATDTSDQGNGVSRDVNTPSATEGLDALWRFVTNSSVVCKSHPEILSRVLFLFSSIWEGGIGYIRIIEALRNRTNFWKQLSSCLSFSGSTTSFPPTLLLSIKAALDPEGPIVSSLSNSQLVSYAFLYTCEAAVLSIMARDIFLQQHLLQIETNESTVGRGSDPVTGRKDNVGPGRIGETNIPTRLKHVPAESGALNIVLEWAKGTQLNSILGSYAHCLYEKESVLRAKAEARVLIVGLMGKVLSGDVRGLDVTLARRIKKAAIQINQHASFEELCEQYSTRGYSSGEQLQVMLISDLFHHLQGELDGGRPIPSGSFQHVADFLVKTEVDILLNPVVSNRLSSLHPSYGDAFIYDTVSLETELGLDCWGHADFGIVTTHVAESTLRWARKSNAVASLGHAQLMALRSWAALLAVSIFNKRQGEGVLAVSTADWTPTKLESYSTELCTALERIMTSIEPFGDATNFTPSFMASQVQILLVFVTWLSSLDASSSEKIHVCSTCAKLIHSVIGCLQKLLDNQCFQQQPIKELVKNLLGALLLLLELMQSRKNRAERSREPGEASDPDMGDAFADVILVGLGFLPSLCDMVENNDYANIAIAVINVLIKSFLAPSTWFPVLQNNFPLALSLSRMYEDAQGNESCKVMLNFCLSFVRFKGGAELLYSAGFFTQLQMLSHHLRDEMSFCSGEMEGPFSVWRNDRQYRGLWSLSVAVVTGLVRALGDKDPTGTVFENAMTYIQLQRDLLVSTLLAPSPILDVQGRKKVKIQRPRTTLSALQDTQHATALMCEVSHHPTPWILKDLMSDFSEMVVHLLAFIAREGLVNPGSSIRSGTGTGFSCEPVQKDEIMAHTRPAVINSSCAWFAVTARGCAAGENISSLRSKSPSRCTSQSLTLSPSRRAGSLSLSPNIKISGSIGGVRASEYSNMVAVHIYKLTFLLLRFLTQQTHHATGRLEEGGHPDLYSFPELPAPEILHGLQDQVVAVVTEVCGKVPNRTEQEVCLVLLSILEMTLYLEVCIAKICGVGPLPLRSDDFGKEYKAMLSAGYPHEFLKASFKDLTLIMSTAHPGLM